MFRRFTSAFAFTNSDGGTQRIPRGWSGEVSDSIAEAADKAGVTVMIGDDGKPIMSRPDPMAAAPNQSPVSEATVAPPAPPAPPAPAPALGGMVYPPQG